MNTFGIGISRSR